jgi:hypothetical protein
MEANGTEICPQCDGLFPMLGYHRDKTGAITET